MTDLRSAESWGPILGPDVKPGPLDLWVRQQEAVLAFGRRSNAQPALPILMQDAGALVGEMLQADFNGVAILEGETVLFLSVAAVTPPSQGPSQPVTHVYGLDATTSLAAYVLSTAAPVTTANLAGEKRFCDLFLRGLGIISALCVPLYLAKRGLGALGIFSTSVREFTGDDARFVETIAHLLASSVGRLQVEEALRRQIALASTVLETIDQLVLILDAKGSLQEINPACERVSGRSSAQMLGLSFWDVFASAEEAEPVRQLVQTASSRAEACEFRSVVPTRSGESHPVAWSLRITKEPTGQASQLLLIGVNQTEQTHPAESAQATSTSPTATEITETVGEMDGVVSEHPFSPVGGKVGRELRRSPRRVFQYRQWIAPMLANRLPTQDQFFEVQCSDISAGGISFVYDRPPEFEQLVVALGQSSQRTYFVARVVRIQVRQEPSGTSYLLGCQFTGRVTLPN